MTNDLHDLHLCSVNVNYNCPYGQSITYGGISYFIPKRKSVTEFLKFSLYASQPLCTDIPPLRIQNNFHNYFFTSCSLSHFKCAFSGVQRSLSISAFLTDSIPILILLEASFVKISSRDAYLQKTTPPAGVLALVRSLSDILHLVICKMHHLQFIIPNWFTIFEQFYFYPQSNLRIFGTASKQLHVIAESH